MRVSEAPLKGCYILKPKVFEDDRGSFFESFNAKAFKKLTGLEIHFVQDNQSVSHKGVLRGFHFQKGKKAQAKLIQVIKGSVQDVVVDLRPNSKTYGRSFSIVLSDENNKHLYIPRGFAHAFLTLEDNTIFSYKCDNFYSKKAEAGIIYNDPKLDVDWNLPMEAFIISDKDLRLPKFKDLVL